MSGNHPRVRASKVCPICNQRKDRGLVACPPCFGAMKASIGAPDGENAIEKREHELEKGEQDHE